MVELQNIVLAVLDIDSRGDPFGDRAIPAREKTGYCEIIKLMNMADVKFGTSQVNNPTPSGINLWVRVFTVVSGAFITWMAMTNLMGPNTKVEVAGVIGTITTIINGLAPFFGVDIQSRSVPTDKVTAIDTKPE